MVTCDQCHCCWWLNECAPTLGHQVRRNAALAHPVTQEYDYLEINAGSLARWICAWRCADHGSVIKGFDHEACRFEPDHGRMRKPVGGTGVNDLAKFRRPTVLLHFRLSGGALYSYHFFDI